MDKNDPHNIEETKKPKRSFVGSLDFFLLPILVTSLILPFCRKEQNGEKKNSNEVEEYALAVKAERPNFVKHTPKMIIQGFVKPVMETPLFSEVEGTISYLSPNFESGLPVNKDEVLLKVGKIAYEAQLAKARAELSKAHLNLRNAKILTQRTKEEWVILRGRSEASPMALKIPNLRVAENEYAAAIAIVNKAEHDLKSCEIKAPYDGKVKSRKINLGQLIERHSELGEIYSNQKWRITCHLLESQALDLNLFQKKDTIKGCLLNQNFPELFVETYSDYITEDTKMLQIHLTHATEILPTSIRFGTFVDIELYTNKKTTALKVKSNSVYKNQLLGVSEEGKLSLTPVKILERNNGILFVKASPKETYPFQIITSRIQTPIAGMKVNVVNE